MPTSDELPDLSPYEQCIRLLTLEQARFQGLIVELEKQAGIVREGLPCDEKGGGKLLSSLYKSCALKTDVDKFGLNLASMGPARIEEECCESIPQSPTDIKRVQFCKNHSNGNKSEASPFGEIVAAQGTDLGTGSKCIEFVSEENEHWVGGAATPVRTSFRQRSGAASTPTTILNRNSQEDQQVLFPTASSPKLRPSLSDRRSRPSHEVFFANSNGFDGDRPLREVSLDRLREIRLSPPAGRGSGPEAHQENFALKEQAERGRFRPSSFRGMPRPSVVHGAVAKPSTAQQDRSSKHETIEERNQKLKMRAMTAVQNVSEESLEPHGDEKEAVCVVFYKIVTNPVFESVFAFAIFTNALLIGVETEWAARDIGGKKPLGFEIIGFMYSLIFFIELLLRVCAHGRRFFMSGADTIWNYFDLFIVTVSTVECVLSLLAASETDTENNAQSVYHVRMARIVRLARLVRFVRIARVARFIQGLRTLISSILGTLRSLFWAMILLWLVIYIFAMAFTQAATHEFASEEKTADESALKAYWGNLFVSMGTLFMALTGGVDWEKPVAILEQLHLAYHYAFLVFIMFTYFAVMNVIIAVFVQSAVDGARSDQAMIVHGMIVQKRQYVQLVKVLFAKIDVSDSGRISLPLLEDAFADKEMQAFFELLEIRVTSHEDAWALFKLLNVDEGHYIHETEFVTGCLRLRGGAQQLDMIALRDEQRYLIDEVCAFMLTVESQLGMLTSHAHSASTRL